jgi:hypothetical protein
MNQRYFLIEPKYSDPDTFCRFTMAKALRAWCAELEYTFIWKGA